MLHQSWDQQASWSLPGDFVHTWIAARDPGFDSGPTPRRARLAMIVADGCLPHPRMQGACRVRDALCGGVGPRDFASPMAAR